MSQALGPRRICFVSNYAYTALTETPIPYIGGAELQQAIIGRCLAQGAHQVSFITNAFCGRREDEEIDGMHILKNYAPSDGIPGLRFFHPRLTGLWRALQRANAEIYYQRCADRATGICALFCRMNRRKFVFAGAHENDFRPDANLQLRDRILYRWGLHRADLILVQSEKQKRLLADNFRLQGQILPNVYPKRNPTTNEGYVLWVGNMHEYKRPMMCVEFAKRYPQISFIMIGGVGGGSQEIYDQVKSQDLPNLRFLGFRPLKETEQYFDGASLCINTSSSEGFPNTYLQAWSRGIPTLGSFDPNNLIADNKLGAVFTEIADVGDRITQLCNANDVFRQRIRTYFETHFSPNKYVERMLGLLDMQ